VSRPVTAAQLASAGEPRDAMFIPEWVPIPVPATEPPGRWAIAGPDPLGLAAGLAAAGVDARAHASLAELAGTCTAGALIPDVVLAYAGGDAVRAYAGDDAGSDASALVGRM